MQAFEYMRPSDLSTAVALLGEKNGKARAMAGGTDLLVQMRADRYQVERVVDVKAIPELNTLRFDAAGGLTVGAAVPCHQIYEHPDVIANYPGLVDATSIVGGIAIQGRASLGGNLCNASPSGDTIPALIVMGAKCRVVRANGEREIPVEQFCIAPGTNRLEPGELLVWINIPAPAQRSGAYYLRFIPRNEMDIAVVGAGAWVELGSDGKTITDARVALGAVAPTPLHVDAARGLLVGTDGSDRAIEAAAQASREAARPISDMRGTAEQRKHLAGVLTKRALRGALARARGEHVPSAFLVH
ncbi:MAG TPA: xanthine dehydrogenase family protein subunit M [Chloroflexota bacterium]|nr:xanthine dehydrogenase family protein subunit M [Chloroflexota bacterium]